MFLGEEETFELHKKAAGCLSVVWHGRWKVYFVFHHNLPENLAHYIFEICSGSFLSNYSYMVMATSAATCCLQAVTLTVRFAAIAAK